LTEEKKQTSLISGINTLKKETNSLITNNKVLNSENKKIRNPTMTTDIQESSSYMESKKVTEFKKKLVSRDYIFGSGLHESRDL